MSSTAGASGSRTLRVPSERTPSPRARWLARIALGLLGLVAVILVALILETRGFVVLAVIATYAAVVVAVSSAWWAFTTRRVWKRRLNIAVVAIVLTAAAVFVALVSLAFLIELVVIALLTLGYVETARRALAAEPASSPSPSTPTPSRPWLLVNTRSGDGKAARFGLIDAARRRGVEIHELVPGDDIRVLAQDAIARGADAVGVAGGDGSLGPVAAAAIEGGVRFLCVPVGTRNHFAADVGLDRTNPLSALDSLDGRERQVDVGLVGDRLFLNNVSLGAYANLVETETYRADKLGTARNLLPAMLRGEDAEAPRFRFRLPDGQEVDDALVLLVGNNEYGQGALETTSRKSLADGVLQISVLRARTGAQLASALSSSTRGQPAGSAGWFRWTSTIFRVDTVDRDAEDLDDDRGRVNAALDGEATVLNAPLMFRIIPGALRVLVPDHAPRRRRLADLLAPLRPSTMRTLARVAVGRIADE